MNAFTLTSVLCGLVLALNGSPAEGSLFGTVGAILTPPTSVQGLVQTYKCVTGTLETGIQVPISTQPGVINNQGALSLATYTLCPQKLTYALESCPICNMDCIVTHNLFGGSCGQNPLIKDVNSPTCLCAETQAEADSRNITTDSTTTCDNPLPKPLPAALATATGLAFYLRGRLLQCSLPVNGAFDSTGCQVDCVNNHGYSGGYCAVETPLKQLDDPLHIWNGIAQPFCHCSNDPAYTPTFCNNNTTPINAGGPVLNTYDLPVVGDTITDALTVG